MAEIDDLIKKMFEEDAETTEHDVEAKLRDIKDPYRQTKPRWRIGYIRKRIKEYLRAKERGIGAGAAPPQERKPAIEGYEIKRHPDIFKPEGGYQPEKQTAPTAGEQEAKEFSVDVYKKIFDRFGEVDRDLSNLADVVSKMNEKLSLMQEEQIATTPQKIVEYDDITLRKDIIIALKKTCDERNIDDESDFVYSLMKHEDDTTRLEKDMERNAKAAKKFDDLKTLIREHNGALNCELLLKKDTDEVILNMRPRMRFGINLKNLFLGIGIGFPLGIIVTIILFFLKVVWV